MPNRDDYDDSTYNVDSEYEEELKKDWSDNYDDFDPSFWEKFYGGPDHDFDDHDQDEEVMEDQESGIVKDRGIVLDVLLRDYVKIRAKLDDLKDEFGEIREKIVVLLEDDVQLTFGDYHFSVGLSKTWQYSDELEKLIEKVKLDKDHERKNDLANLVSTNRFLKGNKLISKIREMHPRASRPWSPEEDKALLASYRSGMPINEISSIHQRQKSALRARKNFLEKERKSSKLIK